jgi:hypothetical protein
MNGRDLGLSEHNNLFICSGSKGAVPVFSRSRARQGGSDPNAVFSGNAKSIPHLTHSGGQ